MFVHKTVLLDEAIEGLRIKEDGIYVDCTLGGAGHSEQIAKRLTTGHLYAFDQDEAAIAFAKEKLAPFQDKVTIIKSNFKHLKEELFSRGVHQVDGILFDLGVSSPQLDTPERGFSYQYDAPLDMRMDQNQELSAFTIVNTWPYEKLVKIFFQYGEEKFSKQIARKIELARKKKTIQTTGELTEIIKEAIPSAARRKGGHPAKRIFQAIRIAVNDELSAFESAVSQAIELLAPEGRICVITFHSLEDRICKLAFRKAASQAEIPRNIPIIPNEMLPEIRIITKKPIVPSEKEIEENRRARSAKLRIAEKIKK
ncbi:16S rRNA (cytosine(1402)-N(4))-methyltransferase RsmH [Aeribacillus pallidus]|uniref:16S rRNA (cytosine(1402)-N(4))-methyltransferase RsmH n=1 Tax=Aeribacillus pallidus TaxID=33936 RepID=UPI000E345FBB|nr:16S rRNA (cytosine(1402)-N(4))-methyltransferase RsmH [Aeribacillus pallidus]